MNTFNYKYIFSLLMLFYSFFTHAASEVDMQTQRTAWPIIHFGKTVVMYTYLSSMSDFVWVLHSVFTLGQNSHKFSKTPSHD